MASGSVDEIDKLSRALAEVVRTARDQRDYTVAALAEASGVSRAMISKVERGEVQPTAALLARLSGPLGLTLSELVARAETTEDTRVTRAHEQSVWTDPETGYTRRPLSAPSSSTGLELVEISLPPRVAISYPASAYRFLDQQVWVMEGRLTLTEGEETHDLGQGDCLRFTEPQDTTFANPTDTINRYLVAIYKRAGQ